MKQSPAVAPLKFNRFTATNCRITEKPGTPTIAFNDSGMVHLNKATCKLLSVAVDDSVEFLQNEEEPSDWYILKSQPGSLEGFTLRKTSGGHSCAFNSSTFMNKIKSTTGRNGDKSFKFKISSEPVMNGKEKLYFLIAGFVKTGVNG